jgi:DNA repair protein SbcD/Mre11
MRLIHTSDWHLGQLFYEYDRTEEHARFLAWLLDTLEAEAADALLVAGDIFDHANPSASSQKQLYRFLTEARRRQPRLNIVLVAGNHDSPGRLEAPSPLLQEFAITVVGQVTRGPGGVEAQRLCVPLKDASGRVAGWCLAVPFLRSADLPAPAPAMAVAVAGAGAESPAFVGPVPPSGAAAYLAGVRQLYQEALAHVLERRGDGQPVVALGHCHVDGGVISGDSERPIVAGGLDALPGDVFDPRLAYVALGHLHRPQPVAGDGRIRYSGAPLPLSFSEIEYQHQVVCVDLDGDRLADVRAVRVPRFAGLLRLPAAPAPVEQVLDMLRGYVFPAGDGLRPYLEVLVRLDGPEPGLRARVDEAIAGRPVNLARIDTSCDGSGAGREAAEPASLDDLARLAPEDIFRQLYLNRFGLGVPGPLLGAFGELLRAGSGEDLA